MDLYPTQVNEGMDARFTGKPLSANPYTLFGDRIEASRFYSWAVGWFTQDDRAKRRKRNGNP